MQLSKLFLDEDSRQTSADCFNGSKHGDLAADSQILSATVMPAESYVSSALPG